MQMQGLKYGIFQSDKSKTASCVSIICGASV